MPANRTNNLNENDMKKINRNGAQQAETTKTNISDIGNNNGRSKGSTAT